MKKLPSSDKAPLLYVRRDIGSGRPIVLLHGMFADGSQWGVISGMLSEYFRVIVIDLLGHGKSPRPKNAKYTAHEHELSLRKTLESINATKDATIVGYSMGGSVALQYASRYDDVAQLFLISSPFYLKPEDMVAAGYANSLFYTKLSVGLYGIVERLLRPGKVLDKLIKNETWVKFLQKLIDSYDNELDSDIMRKNLHELINIYPFATKLSKAKAPITFFCGKRDVFVVQAQLPALKKIKPLMEIEALGMVKNDHMLVQFLPKKMVGVLTRYHEDLLHVSVDKGKGDVIVLLHGVEGSSSYWSNIIPNLSAHNRVIVLDLLGFGKSVKPLNVSYTLDDQVQWVHRTLQAKGIKKFHLAGHSLGALVSMAYAGTYKNEVKSLKLINPLFFDESQSSRRILVRKLKFMQYFSDTSYLVSTVASAVGHERISTFIPAIRSINNAIGGQRSTKLAKEVGNIPTTIIYGEKDVLVDEHQLKAVTKKLQNVELIEIENGTHNFPLSKPAMLLDSLNLKFSELPTPSKSTVAPSKIVRQIAKMAVPVLLIKGAFFLIAGLLLFSDYREETLVMGVSTLVIYQSIQFIRGSFSLKNEGVSHVGYMLVGIFGVIVGYLLTNQFEFTLKIALLVVCGFVLANGLSRLTAGFFWTADKKLRRKQIISGFILTLVPVAVFLGSLVSLYAIIYSIAALLIIRSFKYFFYVFTSLFTAYIRGY